MVHSPLTGERHEQTGLGTCISHTRRQIGTDEGELGKMDSVTVRAILDGCIVRVNVDNEALDGAVGNELRALHPVTKGRLLSRLKRKFSRPRGGDVRGFEPAKGELCGAR